MAIALAGLLVATLGGEAASFGVVFAFCLGLVLLASVPGLRLGHAAESSEG